MLASIAVRGWFPLLAKIEDVRLPRRATAALLTVVGVRFIVGQRLPVPPAALLLVIASLVLPAVIGRWGQTEGTRVVREPDV